MSYVVGMVSALTVLDDIVYVVCLWSSTILLYNNDTYSLLGVEIKVDRMSNPWDMVISDRQLYVADLRNCIWRVSVDDHSYVRWLPTESKTDRFTLSVTSQRLLVTSAQTRYIRQYTTNNRRRLLRVVKLPGYVMVPYHGVETTRGTFVIGHRGTSQSQWQSAVSEILDVTGGATRV